MFQDKPEWIAHQRRRWQRPNWRLWVRPAAERWLDPKAKLLARRQQRYERKVDHDLTDRLALLFRLKGELLALEAELKFRRLLRDSKAYNPNQPRVPAGTPDGGQWTSGDGTSGGVGRNDPRVISDATPDDDAKPGT